MKAQAAPLEPTPITRAPKGKKKVPAASVKTEKQAQEGTSKSWRRQKVQPKEKFDEDFLFSRDGQKKMF